MPNRQFFLGISLSLLFAATASAGETIIDSATHTFRNEGCAATDSCDLKTFTLTQIDYRYDAPAENMTAYGTRMEISYETTSLGTLEKYGVAQFIRGCQFDSRMQGGAVVNEMDVDIEHYGETVPFHFVNEVIDGFVADPLDWGADPGANNRFFYYLNRSIGSAEPRDVDYYGVQKPERPVLYLRDMPGVAEAFDGGTARNISLEFRDCIYKASDVPKAVPDTEIGFAAPIQCFDWSSSFIYDFGSKAFRSPAGIVDFCR